jgi:hypothetical protein
LPQIPVLRELHGFVRYKRMSSVRLRRPTLRIDGWRIVSWLGVSLSQFSKRISFVF